MSSCGCAQGPDGKLLDASDIIWYNDADNNNLILPSSTGATASSSPLLHHQSSAAMLDHFFNVAPAKKIAGSRRSARVPRPSIRSTDPDNAMAPLKRKGSAGIGAEVPHRHARKVVVDTDNETTEDNHSETESLSEPQEYVHSGDEGTSGGGGEDEGDGDSVVDADEDYQYTKSLGDADREVFQLQRKTERTADVHTIFTKATAYVHPVTGKAVNGHNCTVCQKHSLSRKTYFFAGGVSTLRAHISRHKDHFKAYKERCTKLGIPMNNRAIPSSDSSAGIERQTTLDGSVILKPRTPPFSTQGLLDYVVELVVSKDNAFRLIDKGPFRRLLTYLCLSLSDKDIPHHTMIRREILERAELVEARMKAALQEVDGQVLFTFDTWTSDSGRPYLSVTGHYITAPKDKPQAWELKVEQLAFTPFEGHHSGANMAKILIHTVDCYNI